MIKIIILLLETIIETIIPPKHKYEDKKDYYIESPYKFKDEY